MTNTSKKNLFDVSKLIKYMWIFVIVPKEFVLIMSLLCLGFVSLRKKIKLNKITKLTFVIFVIHLLSIVFSYVTNIVEFNRLFAAINTALIWPISGLFFALYKGNKYVDLFRIGKYATRNILILFILSFTGLAFYNLGKNLSIFGNQLINPDWMNGDASYRTLCFMEYPTLIPFFCFMNLPLSLYYLIENKKKYLTVFIIGASIVCCYMSKSRMGLILILFAYFMIFLLYVKTKKNKKKFKFLITILLAFSVIIIPVLVSSLSSMFNARADSNSARFLIYKTSIEMTWSNNLIIGCGIKYMFNGYPLGSHSSVVGAFYKTGFLGLLVFISIWIMLAKILCKNYRNNIYIFAFGIVILLFMMVEDIDGTNWLLIYYFILIELVNTKYYKSNKNILFDRGENVNEEFVKKNVVFNA